MKTYAFLLAALLAVGCTKTETKTVDRPDTELMTLPELGYKGSYTYTYSDSNGGEEESPGDLPLNCFVQAHTSGQAINVCGFIARVSLDAYDFDTEEYPDYGFFALYFIHETGAGDGTGAELNIFGRDPNDYTYEIHYQLTFTSDLTLEDLGLPGFAQSGATKLGKFPRDFIKDDDGVLGNPMP